MTIAWAQIVEGILEGTSKANTRYEEWSNGWGVTDSGVEGLMVASIAEALHERKELHESILMELSMAYVTRWSNARPKRGRRPGTYSDHNRVDMVLLNGSDRPICVIEVKRRWNGAPCLKDLDRVHDLVRRLSHRDNGSLRRGFLAMIIAKSARGQMTAEDRIREAQTEIKAVVRQHFARRRTTRLRFCLGDVVPLAERLQEIYGDRAAAAYCIEIYARQ